MGHLAPTARLLSAWMASSRRVAAGTRRADSLLWFHVLEAVRPGPTSWQVLWVPSFRLWAAMQLGLDRATWSWCRGSVGVVKPSLSLQRISSWVWDSPAALRRAVACGYWNAHARRLQQTLAAMSHEEERDTHNACLCKGNHRLVCVCSCL